MPIKKVVDKAKLKQIIKEKAYDITLHFSRKLVVPLVEQTNSKAKSFQLYKGRSKANNKLDLVVAYHSNTVVEYSIDID